MLGTLLVICALLTPSALTYPYLNVTAAPEQPPFAPNISTTCRIYYPELRVMNSQYPSYDDSPLHGATDFFMLLRQRADTFQIATRVQFTGISLGPDASCSLVLQLAAHDLQKVLGPSPVFNVYQVEREAGSAAMWDTYEARNFTETLPMFGQVNGTEPARYMQWKYHGGLYQIGNAKCNDTLTFQMGMAFDGGDQVNYWDFTNVAPPETPVQGFRLMAGC